MNLASIFEVKTQNQISGSLDSKSMGVATWKTPLHPLIASSKLPSSFRSAFHGIRCVVDALGNSNKCFTFFIFSKINTQKTPPKRKKMKIRIYASIEISRYIIRYIVAFSQCISLCMV